MDQLFNGMPKISYALPLSHSYGSSLSSLIPDKIKSQIWDRKYVETKQLYQTEVRGEIKQDFEVNISNHGPSTVVKVQPNQLQDSDLAIYQWPSAFHYYMDGYLQKFPYEACGLLADASFIRDLEQSCGMQVIDVLDRISRQRICPGV